MGENRHFIELLYKFSGEVSVVFLCKINVFHSFTCFILLDCQGAGMKFLHEDKSLFHHLEEVLV